MAKLQTLSQTKLASSHTESPKQTPCISPLLNILLVIKRFRCARLPSLCGSIFRSDERIAEDPRRVVACPKIE
jgi:hypothetical protein